MGVGRTFAFLAAMSLAGCGHAAHGSGPSADADGDGADRSFVAQMVPHHQLGIRLIDDAVPRVDDVRLRRLIFKMSAYHDSELHEMEHRLSAWGGTAAQRFPGWISQSEVDGLAQLSGPAYDVRWLELMIEHHEGAVTLADAEVARGADAELRALARRIAEAQRDEIEKMTTLLGELCGDSCPPIASARRRG